MFGVEFGRLLRFARNDGCFRLKQEPFWSGVMSVSPLEFQRARKLLESFCERRSASYGSNAQLSCQQEGDSLLLAEVIRLDKPSGVEHFRPLVKLDYRNNRWFLFWSREGGGWQPWPHLSEATSVKTVIDELERAPLHVHW